MGPETRGAPSAVYPDLGLLSPTGHPLLLSLFRVTASPVLRTVLGVLVQPPPPTPTPVRPSEKTLVSVDQTRLESVHRNRGTQSDRTHDTPPPQGVRPRWDLPGTLGRERQKSRGQYRNRPGSQLGWFHRIGDVRVVRDHEYTLPRYHPQ